MAKLLTNILSSLPTAAYSCSIQERVMVNSLALDSRQVKKGSLFLAIRGAQFQAEKFVKSAIESGAVAICCDKEDSLAVAAVLPDQFPLVSIESLPLHVSCIADYFYDRPSKDIFVAAITGTDGKTSVSHYVAQLLQQSAVVGTMGNGPLDNLQIASHTTPNAIALQELFAWFKASEIKFVAMEASSHGLSQGRMAAVNVNTAVLTNLSRDHLDYHDSVLAYKEAKKKLFTDFNTDCIVVNYDDEFGRELYEMFVQDKQRDLVAYTRDCKNAASHLLRAELLGFHKAGFDLRLYYQSEMKIIFLSLIGEFNIENALAVLAVLISTGMPFSEACEKLEGLRAVKGRMQCISKGNYATVVIDYAHTPHALQAAIAAVKQHCQGKVVCVFGCGGDRDKGKRPLMAQAASTADYVIVTSDNPRTEEPDAIINDICQGFAERDQYHIEHDRKNAICSAIENANDLDVVLIAGKGHEDYQIIGNEKIFFSDESVVNECIGETA